MDSADTNASDDLARAAVVASTTAQESIDNAKDSYDAVRLAAEHALQALSATTRDTSKSSSVIANYVHDTLKLSLPVGRSTFGPYLSTIVGSANSRIASAGRGRGGGYYLLPSSDQTGSLPDDSEVPPPKTHTKFEELLYPVFHRWLVGQGHRARVTASMRSLGKWSNPDVTGIRVSEHFGRFDIEVTTIEVKKDYRNWEREFFEAVSHRRYANRAYFAFPLSESMQSKLPDDMRYYSELYNVGVLTLILSDDDHEAFLAGQSFGTPDEYLTDIVEVLTARPAQIPMGYQRQFCEALDIRDIQGLLAWGDID